MMLRRGSLDERGGRFPAGASFFRQVWAEVDTVQGDIVLGEESRKPFMDELQTRGIEESAPDHRLVRDEQESQAELLEACQRGPRSFDQLELVRIAQVAPVDNDGSISVEKHETLSSHRKASPAKNSSAAA
jgi:hypothetical protein